MFLAFGLIYLFLFGLPISFGIGALIGFFVCQFYRKYQIKKASYYVFRGGFLYILSQPISFFFVVFLEMLEIDKFIGAERNYLEGLSNFEMLSAVLFALVFTTTILILLIKRYISKNKRDDE